MVQDGRASIAVRVNGVPAPVDSQLPPGGVFPIYSITKTLTAICALRLATAGAFALEGGARPWVADVDLPDTVTPAHLLRHTSGLRDYGPLPEYHAAVRAHPLEPWTREQFLNAVLPKGLLARPGERWSYSNVGYMLLIELLERASGRAFATLLDEFIVTPLALRRTFVLEQADDLLKCEPGFGSEVTLDRQAVDVRGRYHPGWCAPRVVASTVEETTQIFDALFAGRLLPPAALAEMLTLVPLPDVTEPPVPIGGGMGLYSVHTSPHGPNYSHGGGGPGYDLEAAVFPDTAAGRVSIAVFVNTSAAPITARQRVDAIAHRLIRRIRPDRAL